MAKRKTAEERIKAHREQADKIEAAAKLRALRDSPAWRAHRAAMGKLDDAMICLDASEGSSDAHYSVLKQAYGVLASFREEVFGEEGVK